VSLSDHRADAALLEVAKIGRSFFGRIVNWSAKSPHKIRSLAESNYWLVIWCGRFALPFWLLWIDRRKRISFVFSCRQCPRGRSKSYAASKSSGCDFVSCLSGARDKSLSNMAMEMMPRRGIC